MARRQTQMGDKVAKLRAARRMTQQELAARAGCTQGIISKLEKHVRQNVHSDVLKGLAQALGVTTDFLVGMHEHQEESDDSESLPAGVALVDA